MLKILKVRIQRFRSINDLTVDIKQDNNLLTICGQNNVGKTNVLRAIDLFFNPKHFNQQNDIPIIKNATWGGSVHPKIIINFFDTNANIYYEIIRDFKPSDNDIPLPSGYSFTTSLKHKKSKTDLTPDEIGKILKRIEFIYIESINIELPNLINNITQDILSIQFDRARFTSTKKALKEAYDSYVDGLNEILTIFSNDISSTFNEFKPNWSVKFNVPKNSENFRDLISDDVTLKIDDKGSMGIEEKGSGLQRLAHIIMEFEAADRMVANRDIIICIDEPDIYLHEGLQKKLKNFFDEKSAKMQIICTTHSKIFIDTYRLNNIVLLSCKNFEQFVSRKNKNINVVETLKIDLTSNDSYDKISDHLGIEINNDEVLAKYNILVEGLTDKIYIEELARFFHIDCVNIIPVNGTSKMMQFLNVYESIYSSNSSYKPKIKALLDNDTAGREACKNIQQKKYRNIIVEAILCPNLYENANQNLEKNNTNNEIEDLLYPELVCYLLNKILKKKNLNLLDVNNVCTRRKKPSFQSSGIMSICENEKNDKNPNNGSEIDLNNIKVSMSGLLKIEGDRQLIQLLESCDKKYPKLKYILENLMKFNVEAAP